MNDVLPKPQTRTSPPIRWRDQPSHAPSAANISQEPANVRNIAATGNHSCGSTWILGISASTKEGSATLITHQLIPGTMPAGGLAQRATAIPSSRQVKSSSSALINSFIQPWLEQHATG